MRPYYELADYANDVPGFAQDVAKLDRPDGKLDGKWRDNDIEQLLQGFDTPARTPYQERVVETVIKKEAFGKDDVPDLLYLNFKEIDYVSHVWSMNSPGDERRGRGAGPGAEALRGLPERQVGKGKWAHGAHRRPRRRCPTRRSPAASRSPRRRSRR